MKVRDKFKKIDYIDNLKEDILSGKLESHNFFNLMHNDLDIIDYNYRGMGIRFKNGDGIHDMLTLFGINGPFETFSRVFGKPNCTIKELEDSPRVWAANYNDKFDFLIFVTKKYKGSNYEIIVKNKEIKDKIDPIDFIQWLKDLYTLISNKGLNVSQIISDIDPWGEEGWEENEKMIIKFKKFIQP